MVEEYDLRDFLKFGTVEKIDGEQSHGSSTGLDDAPTMA